MQAARNPIDLDDRQVDAVAARIELDLRIGYAFTRFQTKLIQALGGPLAEAMVSYGMDSILKRWRLIYILMFYEDLASFQPLGSSSTAISG
jgi:hypothetical protein